MLMAKAGRDLLALQPPAPLLFDIFALLPVSDWFNKPVDEMEEVKLCADSGFRPGTNCDSTQTIFLATRFKSGSLSVARKNSFKRKQYFSRVNADCYPVSKMIHKNWFVLSPAMEYYYKPRNPLYAIIATDVMPGCTDEIACDGICLSARMEQPVYTDGLGWNARPTHFRPGSP
jgi:penicillin-binding protein 1C